jgi:hypothetical protein
MPSDHYGARDVGTIKDSIKAIKGDRTLFRRGAQYGLMGRAFVSVPTNPQCHRYAGHLITGPTLGLMRSAARSDRYKGLRVAPR